jgi:hypothetical protein
MVNKSLRPLFINLPAFFVLCFLLNAPVLAQQTETSEKSLGELFETFKTARKLPCGERNTAIQTGKLILELYRDDNDNQEVVRYVKKETADIIGKDRTCARNNLYNILYKIKYWQPFFEVSKYIIAEEGNSSLGLDVMLTLVSVGYNRIAADKEDTYVNDTLYYAKLAIQKIESNQVSSALGKWGAFEPFLTQQNTLGWLNYIIGWITFHRLGATDAGKKKEALPYFYKAVQYKGEISKDWKIFLTIGEWYLDEITSLPADEKADSNNLQAVRSGYADRALIALGRAHKLAVEEKAKKEQIDAIYKRLTEVYKYRFNIRANGNADGLDNFILKLDNQPLPDLTTPIAPIFEEPVELKLNRNKLQ